VSFRSFQPDARAVLAVILKKHCAGAFERKADYDEGCAIESKLFRFESHDSYFVDIG